MKVLIKLMCKMRKNGSNYIPTDIDDLIIRGKTLEQYIESSDFRSINYIKLYNDFIKFKETFLESLK